MSVIYTILVFGLLRMENIQMEQIKGWKDYELLDCGSFSKIERFGPYITIRPEPQAIWDSEWDMQKWKRMAHVEFIQKSSQAGVWKKLKQEAPESWKIVYSLPNEKQIVFNLALTSFKHIGIFPEQIGNWDFVVNFFQKTKNDSGLNLFAYTGGATLAGASAGVRMTHVDSIRQVVGWANRNRQASEIGETIRWIVEDALTFVRKEVRRGKKYELIIMDPPSYGHGPDGEKWKLEDHLNHLLKEVMKILNPERHLFIANVYSLGLSSLVLHNLVVPHARMFGSQCQTGEVCILSQTGKLLPLGNWARMWKE